MIDRNEFVPDSFGQIFWNKKLLKFLREILRLHILFLFIPIIPDLCPVIPLLFQNQIFSVQVVPRVCDKIFRLCLHTTHFLRTSIIFLDQFFQENILSQDFFPLD